ncbi:hypothetical protein AOLI_G00224290 [Acnodon oligacanthus]
MEGKKTLRVASSGGGEAGPTAGHMPKWHQPRSFTTRKPHSEEGEKAKEKREDSCFSAANESLGRARLRERRERDRERERERGSPAQHAR